MKRLLFIIILLSQLSFLHAQDLAGLNDAISALKTLGESGKKNPVGFDIKYIYANETRPSIILDSLNSSIEVAGNNMYCRMDSTEAIRNEKYTILIFGKDKLLMIASAHKDSATDPLLSIQSMIEKSGAISCQVERKGLIKTINISFAPDAACKQLKMVVDTAKGQLLSVDYLVKSTMLVDPTVQEENELPEGYDEYALVRSTYFNYHSLKQPEQRFKEENYFFKEGNEFKPAAAYSDFQVVKATPNL